MKSEVEVEVGKKVETRRERVTRARELFLIDKPRSFLTFLPEVDFWFLSSLQTYKLVNLHTSTS